MNGTRGLTWTHLTIAFIGGAAAGATVALLTAPRSGKETREAVKHWADEVRGRAGRLPQAVGQAVERASQAGKDAFVEAYRPNTPSHHS